MGSRPFVEEEVAVGLPVCAAELSVEEEPDLGLGLLLVGERAAVEDGLGEVGGADDAGPFGAASGGDRR